MLTSPFEMNEFKIDKDADVIFVADLFVQDYVGGAELTTEALINSSDLKIQKVRSSQVTMKLLAQGVHKHWVFGNFSGLNPELIPSIIGNMQYSILEYDYKFCTYRSIEKHKNETGLDCNCEEQLHGKLISSFFHAAKTIWWMSEAQEKRYLERFPFLQENERVILSSVFDEDVFAAIKNLNDSNQGKKREGWIVLGSDSWIKGASDAKEYCEDNKLSYEILQDVPYGEVLQKLSTAEGFVYLPRGGDTCPRMVIEAKLLGCELIVNSNVQHHSEEWFNSSPLDMVSYLYAARERFWRGIKYTMSYTAGVSGYTTVRNGNNMGYPWQACIQSMLGFCSEVVVLDGGSSDGTWEELQAMAAAQEDGRIKAHQHIVNEDDPSFAYESDGKLKASARMFCTQDFCWQMDADEIVHEDDYDKINQLIRAFPKLVDVMALPIIEYWGSAEKVRVDVNPWKWRLSRNVPHVTQGIPSELRKFDEDGNEYAAFGTDTCDYIHTETRERLETVTFYSQEVHNVRVSAVNGSPQALRTYEEWMGTIVDQLPVVHHYSWFDISTKIKQYKKHWAKFWKSQYRHDTEDTPENNVMFDKKWADVTDNDIEALALKLTTQLGGWIFHEKVDFSKPTPHIKINRNHPDVFLQQIKE